MKMKSVVLLVVALGCGLVAMLGVQQVMSSSPEVEPKPVDEVKVLVATQRIEPFSSMDDSNTGFKTIPKSVVPEGAVLSRSEYADKKLRYGASKGDIITAEKLIDKNYSASNEIPPGMRVVTVKVNQTKIHSGLLRPGDNVDVVLTYKAVKTGRRPVQRTVTVLQRVKVFAIDEVRLSTIKDSDGNEIKAKNVSLLATPEDGNLLMLAENAGQLTLALRNADDTATDTKVAAITADDLGRARRGAKVSGTDGGFGEFLRNRQDGQKQPKGGDGHEKSDDNDNQPPKWKLTIFTGSERRVVEVEDPSAVIPEKKKRADEKDSQPTPKTGAETGA